MPIIKSAKKREEIKIRNNARNKADRSELATAVKKVKVAIEENNVELAEQLLPETFSTIDEAVSKKIIHKNKANNTKATLSSNIAKMKTENN